MNLNDLSSEQLKNAANIKDQITALQKQLQGILGGAPSATNGKVSGGGLSAAARAKISAAAKARWAKVKSSKGNVVAMPATGKKTMSAAAKAKISAAAKARWAKIKAAKGK